MVEDIERFRSELQLQVFIDGELTPDAEIHLPSAKKPGEIAWSVPLHWYRVAMGIEYQIAIGVSLVGRGKRLRV
jgi:hypothetical protein